MANDYTNKNGRNIRAAKVIPMWRSNERGGDGPSWADVDASLIRGTIDAVAKAGGAVMFSVTSDGGALSVCLLQEKEKIKEYPSNKEKAEELLRSLIDFYTDAVL